MRARSSELMIEKKKPLKAQLAGELAAAADDAERTSIRAEFEARERILEHEIDHTPRELSMVRRASAPTCVCHCSC